MSFFAELKRRNVFRVAAGYGVVAWLLVQVSTTLLPLFAAPTWIARALVVVLAVGAIPVLAWAWIYQLTPEGLKTQDEADAAGLSSRLAGPRLSLTIVALLLLAVALFALGRYSGPTAVAIEAADASIAVLPFVNMSADKDNEYFSDGLSETLLNMLAQVPNLKVVGRTSSFAFKGKNEDLRSIGAALSVANVLEGSVQKIGNTVRITAQLIAVSDGTHRWSKSYDRKLDDVFRIQDEIATEVVGALRIALQPGVRDRLTLKRTDNVEAYEEYLKGIALLPQRTVAALRESARHFERALELDPDFALAYVGAADSYLLLDGYSGRDAQRMARAKRYVERAMEISPDLGEAHASLGLYLQLTESPERAEYEFKRAIELAPSHASAYLWYASQLRGRPGRRAEALALSENAAALEPLSPILQSHLAESQAAAGRIAEGRATLARLVRRFPEYPAGHLALAKVAASEGDLIGTLRSLQTLDALDPDAIPNRVQRCALLAAFDAHAEVKECLARFAQIAPAEQTVLVELAWSALLAGRGEAALLLIERMPADEPFTRMAALLNLRRAPEALLIAQKVFPEFLIEPTPEIAGRERAIALLIGSVLTQAGEQESARGLFRKVLQAAAQTNNALEAPWPWYEPVALALLGQSDAAIAALRREIANGRFVELQLLDGDTHLSGLRSDPRYEATVAPARAKAAEQVRLAQAAGLL